MNSGGAQRPSRGAGGSVIDQDASFRSDADPEFSALPKRFRQCTQIAYTGTSRAASPRMLFAKNDFLVRASLVGLLAFAGGIGCAAPEETDQGQAAESSNFIGGGGAAKGESCSKNSSCGDSLTCRPRIVRGHKDLNEGYYLDGLGKEDSTCQPKGQEGESCDYGEGDKDCVDPGKTGWIPTCANSEKMGGVLAPKNRMTCSSRYVESRDEKKGGH